MYSTFLKIASIAFLAVTQVCGHIVEQVYLTAEVEDGVWALNVTFDAAYSLSEMRDDPDSPQPERQWLFERTQEEHAKLREGAEAYLRESIALAYAGETVSYEVSFPDYESSPPDFPSLLNGGAYFTVRISGEIPHGSSGEFTLSVSEQTKPDFVVALKSQGKTSYVVIPPSDEKLLFNMEASGASKVPSHGLFSIFWLGYRHVLPDGLDHVLFIMGLFLMARQWRPLFSQSLTFTVAHSVTLGLASSGVFLIHQWPGAWLIEPLIAMSIVVVALENIFSKDMGARRLVIIFVFGLIHGLGFAGSLGAALHKDDNWLTTLAVANLGVEIAQITILAIAWCITLKWCESDFYQKFRLGASVLIAVIGSFWVVERLLT